MAEEQSVIDSPVGQRQFQEFKEGLDKRFETIDKRFDAIDKRFERLERFGFTMLGSLVVGMVFLIFKSL